MFRILLIIGLFLTTLPLSGQISLRDSTIKIPSFGFGYSILKTSGDLTEKTTYIHSLSPGINYKFRSNFFLKLQFNILFGSGLNEDSMAFEYLKSDVGYPIDYQGFLTSVKTNLTGYSFLLSVGKILKKSSYNPNSGLCLDFGLGFLQHKIQYNYPGSTLPQLEGEYLKGYDHLTNGLLLQQNLGYILFSNKNYFSFYIGFTANEGFTKNRRSWNIDTRSVDDRPRLDIATGFEAKVLFPILPKSR